MSAQNVADHTITTSEKVKEYLNTLVATQGLFYVKLHQAHWYVKGSSFFELHEKLEELYDEMTVQMDDVAERLLAVGGEPYSTLKEFAEHSVIEESSDYYKHLDQKELVKKLVEDFRVLQGFLGKGIDLADGEGNDVTTDMLIAQKAFVDKTVWMLQAFLGRGALD